MSEKFYIMGYRSSMVEEEIEARDLFSACLEFKYKNPGCDIFEVNGKQVIDFCCVCAEPIFLGEQYYTDCPDEGEHNRWCLKHGVEV